MNRLVGFDTEPIIENLIADRKLCNALFVCSFAPEDVGIHDFRNNSRNANDVRCNNSCHDLRVSDTGSMAKVIIETHLEVYEEGSVPIQCRRTSSIFPTEERESPCDETRTKESAL